MLEKVKRRREGEGEWFSEVLKKSKEDQRKERWERIRESKYNK